MALSLTRKQQLARMEIPSDVEMRERVRSFIARSGMTGIDFSEAIGYSNVAVSHFVNGNYDRHQPGEGNTLAIRAAAKEFMDLHDVDMMSRAQGTHHRTKSYQQIHSAALSALAKGTAYIVDGPPGTEKTHSFLQIERHIREKKLGRCVYVYSRISHTPQSFLQEICTRAGLPSTGNIDQLIRKLRFFLGRERTLLMIDEGQHLEHPGLEVLRQLLDEPPFFGVIIGGSHDLTQRLSHWQMEQWRSRVRKSIYLTGPSREECYSILRAELGKVSDEACEQVVSQCVAEARRTQIERGKVSAIPFTYYSARLLFHSIEAAKEALALKADAA